MRKHLNNRSVVDVIIPYAAHHRSRVAHAVESVSRSTIDAWRVLLVNDSGQDDEAFEDERIVYLHTKGGEKASVARNMGLDAATSPFVTFLDADDWLLNTSLEMMLRAYTLFDTGYVYGDAYTIEEDGQTGFLYSPVYDRQAYLSRNQHHITALIPTDLAREVRFDVNTPLYEDYEFYIHMAAKGYCGTRIPYPIIVYNMGAGSNYKAAQVEQVERGLADSIANKYRSHLEGRPRMACCGGSADAKELARQALLRVSNPQVTGDTSMEYMGLAMGSVTYVSQMTGRKYLLGALDPYRYFTCDARDVAWLQGMNCRIVPTPSTETVLPTMRDLAVAEPVSASGNSVVRENVAFTVATVEDVEEIDSAPIEEVAPKPAHTAKVKRVMDTTAAYRKSQEQK